MTQIHPPPIWFKWLGTFEQVIQERSWHEGRGSSPEPGILKPDGRYPPDIRDVTDGISKLRKSSSLEKIIAFIEIIKVFSYQTIKND